MERYASAWQCVSADNTHQASRIAWAETQAPLVAALILLAAVGFNAALAMVNGHFATVPAAAVVGTEVVLVAGTFAVAALNYRKEMAPWFLLAGLLVFIAILRGLATGGFEPKYLRDVALIPAFALLGMAAGERWLARTVITLHGVVLAVFILEALAPDAYSELFKIQDYYINTRGTTLDQFYDADSELFISATRPESRFLSFITAPRLSSVFLEPVSLGNYCIIIIAFACACIRRLGVLIAAFLIVSAAAMLVACDGRLAAITSALILLVMPLAPRLPDKTAALYLPAAVIGVFGLVTIAGWEAGTDDFQGRLAHTVELLQRFDAAEWLGLSNTYIADAMDSGLAYLITTQSLLGLVLLWVWVAWGARECTIEQVRFAHALCLYLSLTMLVSYSFLTIKTAALLWFIHGALQSTPSPAASPTVWSDGLRRS